MSFALAPAWGFALVLMRTAGLVMTAPVTSEQGVPPRARIGIAVGVAMVAFLGASAPAPEVPGSVLTLALACAGETAFGALAGLGARWVLSAAEAAGQLAGLSMGLGYGASVSPGGADSAVTSRLFHQLALAAAVALGLHREGFAWLSRSVRLVPPGGIAGGDLQKLALQALSQALLGVGLSVRVAFPVLVATTAGHAALALAGRFSPQLNLQSIGFSISILAGAAALYLFMPAAVELVARQAALVSHG